jgi:hypothetical protein
MTHCVWINQVSFLCALAEPQIIYLPIISHSD